MTIKDGLTAVTSPWVAMRRDIVSNDKVSGWFPGQPMLKWTYMRLVLEANWADATTVLRRQKKPLKMGQCVIGLDEFAAECGLTVQVLRTILTRLVQLGRINKQTNNHGTIITICDYEVLYRFRPVSQQADQQAINKQLTSDQQQHNKGTKQQSNKNSILGARARAKKLGQEISPLEEAVKIGRLLFMPTHRGSSGGGFRGEAGAERPRFVDLVALDACMADALADVGLEPLRTWLAEAKVAGNLGHYVFDANRVSTLARRYLAGAAGGPT